MQMWADGSMAYYSHTRLDEIGLCGTITNVPGPIEMFNSCFHNTSSSMVQDLLCEITPTPAPAANSSLTTRGHSLTGPTAPAPGSTTPTTTLPNSSHSLQSPERHVVCPKGHVIQAFLACDEHSACWGQRDDVMKSGEEEEEGRWSPTPLSCAPPMTSVPPSMTCEQGAGRVPYSLVCDGRQDCVDSSDEDFCVLPHCGHTKPLQCSLTKQCKARHALCDGQPDCQDRSDEVYCEKVVYDIHVHRHPPPAVVTFRSSLVEERTYILPHFAPDHTDHSTGRGPPNVPPCPATHFQCAGEGYCLPVYVLCNKQVDCPGREDEEGCSTYTCPGMYRCRGSSVCLHLAHVCDGLMQCPQHDDEFLCALLCPQSCTCHGLAFTCSHLFSAHQYPELRYLDVSHTGMGPEDILVNTMLVYLSLANCSIATPHNLTSPNLRALDLSDNRIALVSYEHLSGVANLLYLRLSGNPMSALFVQDDLATVQGPSSVLQELDLSRVVLPSLNLTVFARFVHLRVLNLSHSQTAVVTSDVKGRAHSQNMKSLRVVDLRGCPMTSFPLDVFAGFQSLRRVDADTYRLCCPGVLPPAFHLADCRAPADLLSSCPSLLGSTSTRVAVTLAVCLALLGSAASLVIRIRLHKARLPSRLDDYVTQVTLCDLVTGVHVAVVSVADRVYAGRYWQHDVWWRHSAVCTLAGFLSHASCQTSSFLLALLTAESVLAVRFPVTLTRHSRPSPVLMGCLAWVLGLLLSVALLLGWGEDLYNQSAFCTPVVVMETRARQGRVADALDAVAVVNTLLLSTAGLGQAALYGRHLLTHTSALEDVTVTSADEAMTRRLMLMLVTDTVCGMARGAALLLASRDSGVPRPALFVTTLVSLTLPSAVNQALYAYSLLLEHTRRERRARLIKYLKAKSRKRPG